MSSDNEEKFNHPYIGINQYNKKFSKIILKKSDDDWEDFLDDTLEYSKEHRCWVLKNSEMNDFIYMVNNVSKQKFKSSKKNETESESEEESESESESESDSTDDELIQKALARRLTSESKQLEIDSRHISDSELEDVISGVRRTRHIYKIIDDLTDRIKALEANVSR